MTLIEEVQSFFGSQNLYDVLGIPKDSSPEQIKKAYRKASLKIHPDRVGESEKEQATKKFQVLAQVHYVLSDPERKTLYDNHGIIANEDGLDSEADWSDYWRLLFPKITTKDIESFYDRYIGSEEEENDLIGLYERFEGDMDKICECHMSYDEQRTTDDLNRLIKEGKIKKLKKFTNESQAKKDKRKKKFQREARRAAKAREQDKGEDEGMDGLIALIKNKQQNSFDSMISSLEAKYATKGTKRKRADK